MNRLESLTNTRSNEGTRAFSIDFVGCLTPTRLATVYADCQRSCLSCTSHFDLQKDVDYPRQSRKVSERQSLMNPLAAALLAAQGWDLSKYGQSGSDPNQTNTINDTVRMATGQALDLVEANCKSDWDQAHV